MIDRVWAPTTRRELRLAERRTRRAPWARLAGLGRPRPGRHAHPRSAEALMAPIARFAVCALLLVGGMSHAQVLRTEHAAEVSRAAAVNAAEHEVARLERVSRTTSTRLTAAAAAYAAHRLDAALTVAQAAVDNAGVVVATAAPVVSSEQLSPLDAAVTELTAIIESSPRPAEVIAPAHTDATPRASDSIGSDAEPPATTGSTTAPPDTTTAVPPAARAGTVPSALTTGMAADPSSPVSASSGRDAPVATVPTETLDAPTEPGSTDGPSITVASPARPLEATADLSTLGLEVSARLIAAAQAVAVLTSQVQAVAEASIAAAAQAERDWLAGRIAAAEDAPNGQILLDSLCGVGFAADVLLRCDAAAALEQLNTAYQARFGTDLEVVSSYRDLTGQATAREVRGTLAAVPGTSNHGRGLAVDLGRTGSVGQFDAPAYLWLKAHAETYGWHHPVYMEPGGNGPLEPWHWEFGTMPGR